MIFFFFNYPNTEEKEKRAGEQEKRTQKRKTLGVRTGGRENDRQGRIGPIVADWAFTFQFQRELIDLPLIDISALYSPPPLNIMLLSVGRIFECFLPILNSALCVNTWTSES